ncbi:MAG: NAD(P)-dependent oxidoreductase [Pseudomonadota bacterium]
MKKVFIAGGTGMLGANTALAFAKAGIEVVVSSRKKNDAVGAWLTGQSDLIRVETVELSDAAAVQDVFDRHAFDGMVLVVHTHQYARTRDKNNEIYPIMLNCLETARKSGVKRTIFGGSMAVYGELMPPFDETVRFPPEVGDPPMGDGLVLKFEVATKRALEIIALDYGTPFQMGLSVPPGTENPEPHTMDVAVLRSPMMFGPFYQAMGSPMGIAAHVAAGKLERFAGLPGYGGMPIEKFWAALASVPINYVKDNAECIRIAMTAERLPHRVYNVSSGFPRAPRAQLEALLAAAPECADRMGVTPDDLPSEAMDVGFDGDLFAQDFGWRSPHTLESALSEYIGWLASHDH